MHSFTFPTVLLSASLVSGVLASANIPRALVQVRQVGGDAFIPGTRQGFGSTCVDAFGPNSKLCANSDTCYDASIGDSCCSEGYPCGSGSYCLVKGYCCPDVRFFVVLETEIPIQLGANLPRPAPPPNAHSPMASPFQPASPSRPLNLLSQLQPLPRQAHEPLPKPPPQLPLLPPPPAPHPLPSLLEPPPLDQLLPALVLSTLSHPLPRLAHHLPLSNPSQVVPRARRLLVGVRHWPLWLLPVP